MDAQPSRWYALTGSGDGKREQHEILTTDPVWAAWSLLTCGHSHIRVHITDDRTTWSAHPPADLLSTALAACATDSALQEALLEAQVHWLVEHYGTYGSGEHDPGNLWAAGAAWANVFGALPDQHLLERLAQRVERHPSVMRHVTASASRMLVSLKAAQPSAVPQSSDDRAALWQFLHTAAIFSGGQAAAAFPSLVEHELRIHPRSAPFFQARPDLADRLVDTAAHYLSPALLYPAASAEIPVEFRSLEWARYEREARKLLADPPDTASPRLPARPPLATHRAATTWRAQVPAADAYATRIHDRASQLWRAAIAQDPTDRSLYAAYHDGPRSYIPRASFLEDVREDVLLLNLDLEHAALHMLSNLADAEADRTAAARLYRAPALRPGHTRPLLGDAIEAARRSRAAAAPDTPDSPHVQQADLTLHALYDIGYAPFGPQEAEDIADRLDRLCARQFAAAPAQGPGEAGTAPGHTGAAQVRRALAALPGILTAARSADWHTTTLDEELAAQSRPLYAHLYPRAAPTPRPATRQQQRPHRLPDTAVRPETGPHR